MAVTTEAELPQQSKTLWLKAVSAFQTHNYGYSIQLLQNIVQGYPHFFEGRKLLRRAEFAKNKGKKGMFGSFSSASISVMKVKPQIKKDPLAALAALEKLVEGDPLNIDVNLAIRDAALAADMPEFAQFTLETLCEAHPKDVKLLHELGRFYIDQSMAHKAVDVYNKILELNPTDMEASKLGRDASARASMTQGGWETADSYRDLIVDKEQAILLEQQSRVTKSGEMIDNQLADLLKQYEANNQNIDVVRRMAVLYEEKQDFENAIAFYEWGKQLTSGSDPIFERKVGDLRARITEHRTKELEAWLAEAGEEHPEAAGVAAELESLRQAQATQKLDEARARVDRNPTDLSLRLELGELLLATGQYKEAIPQLQQAQRNPSGRYKAMGALATCYVQNGMLDLAKDTLETAAGELKVMDDLKKGVVYQLGVVYENLGRESEAVDIFKQIYAADYGYRDVSERVERFYAKQRNDQAAG